MGEMHAKLIAEREDTELVAVFSRDVERARGLTNSFGGDPTTDLGALLGREDVDAVSICTASGEHATFAIPAARAGKHVLVEKPIDISLERADAMIRACEDSKVRLGVIFQLRFQDASTQVKKALDEGVLGRLVMADCYMKFYRPQEYYDGSRWKGTLALDGGGALMNQGIHGVDLLLHLAGDVASVQAYTGILAHDNIEVEDTCVAALKYESGALGVLQATTSVHPASEQRIELHGTEGTIILEGTGQTWIAGWETFAAGKRDVSAGLPDLSDAAAVAFEEEEALRRQIGDFAAAVREGREPLVSGIEGRRSLAVVRAVYESARVGGEARVGRVST